MTDFHPLAATYEKVQDSNKMHSCIIFGGKKLFVYSMRTANIRSGFDKTTQVLFLGIGEIHKMSHNMVSNQEDFTAPIALLKINRSRRSNLIIPRDLVPRAFPLKVGEAGKGPGFGWSRVHLKYS